MVAQKSWQDAAWLVWVRLETASHNLSEFDFTWLSDIVEKNEELESLLGTYWLNKGWIDVLRQDKSYGEVEYHTEELDTELKWSAKIDEIVFILQSATISDDLTPILSDAAAEFAKLRRLWDEQGLRSEATEQALLALQELLQQVVPPISLGSYSISELIAGISKNGVSLAELNRILASLREMVKSFLDAERAEQLARDAQESEDSEKADAAYAESRAARRKTSTGLQQHVTEAVVTLLASKPIVVDSSQFEPEADPTTASNIEEDPDGIPFDIPIENLTATVISAGSIGTQGEDATQVLPFELASVVSVSSDDLCDVARPLDDISALVDGEESFSQFELDLGESPMLSAINVALTSRRYGLAYQLAAAADLRGLEINLPSPVILEALVVGSNVAGAGLIPAATRYKMLQEGVLLELDSAPSPADRLTVFAGALRPALFAPDSSGVEILARANLGEYGAGLHALCQFISSEIRGRGLTLSPGDFEPASADGDRKAAEIAAREALLAFAGSAHNRKLKFHRGITIWTDLFRIGPIADAVHAIRARNPNALEKAVAAAGWIDDDITAERRVDLLDIEHRTKKDRPLEAGVRLRLADWLRQTARHLRAWIDCYNSCQSHQREHILEKIHDLHRHLQAAKSDLQMLETSTSYMSGAVASAIELVSDLLARGTEPSPTLEMALYDELLLFSPPILNQGEGPLTPEEADIVLIEGGDISSRPADYAAAFMVNTKAGRFIAARRLMDRLAITSGDISAFEKEIRLAADICQHSTVERAEKLRLKVDGLLGADQLALIDVRISTRLDTIIATIQPNSSNDEHLLDFANVNDQLDEIEADVRDGFEILLVPIRERIPSP
jgi:hypothetical protein